MRVRYPQRQDRQASFDLTYEGLKRDLILDCTKLFLRFDLTYEGLKSVHELNLRQEMTSRFDLTYEGLKLVFLFKFIQRLIQF